MAEDDVTTVRSPDGRVTHTTVNRSGSGSGAWVLAIAFLVVLIAGLYLYSRYGTSQINKDNAIAEAASDVGDAAQNAGNAAREAADELKKE